MPTELPADMSPGSMFGKRDTGDAVPQPPQNTTITEWIDTLG